MTIHAREAPETARSSSSADTVREAVETAEDLPYTRPVINAADGNLERLGKATWAAILKANDPPKIFRVGTVPSRLENADDGALITKPLDMRRMCHYLAGIAEWVKIEDGNPKPVHPPSSAISYALATPDPPLPVLSRIVDAPVFAPDGSIHTEPGYDPAARLWFAPAPGFKIPPVSEKPSPIEIKKASRLVREPIWDFPFVSQADQAHAIAYLLLPFVRELIDGPTPLHLVEKPGPGTGATLLVDCLAYPSLGRPLPVITEGRDEDEWRKRLTSKLQSGPSIILLDNLRRRLDSAALAAAITAPVWEDRILGRTEITRLSVRCVWLATGNNPSLSNEIARRSIRIRLDAKVDRPWQRAGFTHPDLRGWVRENRERLVWAALTLGRAWIATGKPRGKAKPLGMFESWTETVGGILEVAGIPGFLENAEEFYETSDVEAAAWRDLINEWWRRFESEDVGVAELWDIVAPENGEGIGDFNLGRGSEKSQRTRFGVLLRQQRDRRYEGLRITAGGTRKGSQQWRLVKE
jgi:hypothetical protein